MWALVTLQGVLNAALLASFIEVRSGSERKGKGSLDLILPDSSGSQKKCDWSALNVTQRFLHLFIIYLGNEPPLSKHFLRFSSQIDT